MARLLAAQPDLDGVFVASDLMATGALKVLAASGRRVPADVSVVGYDDSILATTASPPLTSVRQPLEEMGQLMVDVLLDRIADPDAPPVQRILPTQLTRRESVCRASPADAGWAHAEPHRRRPRGFRAQGAPDGAPPGGGARRRRPRRPGLRTRRRLPGRVHRCGR